MSSYAASLLSELQEALTLHNREGKKAVRGPFIICIGHERFLLDGLESLPSVRLLGLEEAATGTELVYRDESIFQAVFERRLKPEQAWRRGDLTLKGNLSALGQLRTLFSILRKYREAKRQQMLQEEQLETEDAAGSAPFPVASAPTGPSPAVTPSGPSGPSGPIGLTPVRLLSPSDSADPRFADEGASSSSMSMTMRVLEREEWAPDSEACFYCQSRFGLFNRPHHCRFCGQCVCDAESRLRFESLRICDHCAKKAVRRMSRAEPTPTTPATPATPAVATPFPTAPQPSDSSRPRQPSFATATTTPSSPAPSSAGASSQQQQHQQRARRLQQQQQRQRELLSSAGGSSTSTSTSSSTASAVVASTVDHHHHDHHHEAKLETMRKTLEAVEGEVKALREARVSKRVAELHSLWHLPGKAVFVFLSLAAFVDLSWFVFLTRFLPLLAAGKKTAASSKKAALPMPSAPSYPFSVFDAGDASRTWRNRYVFAGILLVLALLAWLLRPSGLLGRRLKAFFTAAVILLRLRSLRARTAHMSDDESQPMFDEENAVLARFAFENMLSLKAFWIKLGQYVASRVDIFPRQFIVELSKLQDATEPMPFVVVREVLENELRTAAAAGCNGSVKLESVFASFDEKPLASASIAQVHRAKLRNPVPVKLLVSKPKQQSATSGAGSAGGGASATTLEWETKLVDDVVVKVQHKGVDRLMLSDLTTLQTIVRVVAALEADYDFRFVIDEWAHEAKKELDFRREAAITSHIGKVLAAAEVNARTAAVVDVRSVLKGGFQRAAATASSNNTAGSKASASASSSSSSSSSGSFPEAYYFATPRLMVMEFVQALRVTDIEGLEREGVDKTRYANDVVEAFSVCMMIEGCFSADPHAANVLCELLPSSKGARPVLLDFGLSKILPDSLRLSFCKMVSAAKDADAGGILDAFDEMGVKLNREDPGQDLEIMQFTMRDAEPAAQARRTFQARRKVWQERIAKRRAMKLKRPVESFPPALIFWMRTSEMLRGLSAKLDAHVPLGVLLERASRAALRTYGAALASSSSLLSPTRGAVVDSSIPPHRRAVDPAFSILHSPPEGANDLLMLTEKRILHVRECCKKVFAPAPTLTLAANLPVREAITFPSSYRCKLEERVYGLLRELWTNGEISGCQVAVMRHGRLVVDAATGELSPLNPLPMRQDSLVNCFSVTKGIVATLFHVLMQSASQSGALSKLTGQKGSANDEAGLASEYALRVTELWPSFASGPPSSPLPQKNQSSAAAAPQLTRRQQSLLAAKAGTTVSDILSHTAGLQHALPGDITMSRFADITAMVKSMEAAVPSHRPGSHTSYHYYTFGWLMAGLIDGLVRLLDEREGGSQGGSQGGGGGVRSLGKLLKERILKPLSSGTASGGGVDMEKEMFIGLPQGLLSSPSNAARLATLSGSFFAGSNGASEANGAAKRERKTGHNDDDDSADVFSDNGSSASDDDGAIDGAGAGTSAGAGQVDESSAKSSFARLQSMLEMAEKFAAEPDDDDGSDSDAEEAGSTGDARSGTIASLFGAGSSSNGGPSVSSARMRDLKALSRLITSLKERLFLLDPRLFNRPLFRRAEIPAANGHFSARALCRFYACLGQPLFLAEQRRKSASASASAGAAAILSPDFVRLPSILSLNRLRFATSLSSEEQQATNLFVQGGWRTRFGLGFQLYFSASADNKREAAAATSVSTFSSPPSSSSSSLPSRALGMSPALPGSPSAVLEVPSSSNGKKKGVSFRLPNEESNVNVNGAEEEGDGEGKGPLSPPPPPPPSLAARGTNISPPPPPPPAPSRQQGQGSVQPFGHSGFGGSIAFYDPTADLAVAITVNRLTNHKGATAALLRLIAESEGGAQFVTF